MSGHRFVPWGEIFSYNADGTIVLGARDMGKTFGLREQFLRDYRDGGYRFVAVSRVKERIPKLAAGYFDKIAKDTEDSKLRAWLEDERIGFRYMADRIECGHMLNSGKLSDVKTIGYFVALTKKQNVKEQTYMDVRRIVMDECIIEPDERRYTRYQGDEWGKLANIVDSVTRERPYDEGRKPNIYLLGNACDLVNPWFRELGINEMPTFGYHWYLNKTWLLDYIDPADFAGDYVADKLNGTVSGRMLKHRPESRVSAGNLFDVDDEFVEKRPRGCAYESGYIYRGHVYGFWVDYSTGMGYICDDWCKGDYFPMYALTTEDNKINFFAADKARKALKNIVEMYSLSMLRFSSVGVQTRFMDLLRDFGLK